MPHRLRNVSGLLWVLPALLLVCVFVYYPVVDNFRLSFYKYSAFSESRFVGLDNYTQALNDPVFWSSLRNNIAYAVTSIIVQVGGGLALAALLEDIAGARIRSLLRTVYFIPAVVSITVAGVLFTFLYHPEIGLLDQALRAVGLDSWARNWLGEESTAIWAIIGMSQWQSIGYVTMLYTIAIQRVPRELYEAAYIDGASKVRTFFSITVPLVREMTALLTIVTISGAFLVFNEVVAMTDGGPNNSSHVLGTWLYKSAFFNDDMGYASAIATVIFALTVAVAVVQLAQTRRKQVAF